MFNNKKSIVYYKDVAVGYLAGSFITLFGSKKYKQTVNEVVELGMEIIDAANKQNEKTPDKPFGVQVGFNGHDRLLIVEPPNIKQQKDPMITFSYANVTPLEWNKNHGAQIFSNNTWKRME